MLWIIPFLSRWWLQLLLLSWRWSPIFNSTQVHCQCLLCSLKLLSLSLLVVHVQHVDSSALGTYTSMIVWMWLIWYLLLDTCSAFWIRASISGCTSIYCSYYYVPVSDLFLMALLMFCGKNSGLSVFTIYIRVMVRCHVDMLVCCCCWYWYGDGERLDEHLYSLHFIY